MILSVCHVLRYTPWVKKVKEIIDSGKIGEVVNINHTEPVSINTLTSSTLFLNINHTEPVNFNILLLLDTF